MPIIYKVVTRINRTSCFAPNPFSLKYKKGAIVNAIENSVGIVCSKTLTQAEIFISTSGGWNRLRAIKVRGIGRGRRIQNFQGTTSPSVIRGIIEEIKHFGIKEALKRLYNRSSQSASVLDVICYKSVEVLE